MTNRIQSIRNDDVAADTTLHEIKTFCEICDRYGVGIIHAITPIGRIRQVHCDWKNAEIRERTGNILVGENRELMEYLRGRKDKVAAHGLWHTHRPSWEEIEASYTLLAAFGIHASYYVPPFNEGPGAEMDWAGLKVLGAEVPRLEDYLESGSPDAEIVYLHGWRFEYGPWNWKQLDSCLKRLTTR